MSEPWLETHVYGDAVRLDLWYPRPDPTMDHPRAIEIGLMDVRAADDIRVEYDFDRDGWVIKQHPSRVVDDAIEDVGDWQEVAFVRAWALEEVPTNDARH